MSFLYSLGSTSAPLLAMLFIYFFATILIHLFLSLLMGTDGVLFATSLLLTVLLLSSIFISFWISALLWLNASIPSVVAAGCVRHVFSQADLRAGGRK